MVEPSNLTPAVLRATMLAVEEFLSAFKHLMELYGRNTELIGGGLLPDVFPLEDADPDELLRRSNQVSRAAGRAYRACSITGIYVMVHSASGAFKLDPIAAWQSITQPKPPLSLEDVIGGAEQVAGRLENMLVEAEAQALPPLDLSTFHPAIAGAASVLWRDGHRRNAIATAAEALILQVRNRVGRTDVQADSLWKESLSLEPPQPGKPRLRYPGDDADLTVKAIRGGTLHLAQALNALIRNTATHAAAEVDASVGLEQLAALSLLARHLDECVVLTVDDEAVGS